MADVDTAEEPFLYQDKVHEELEALSGIYCGEGEFSIEYNEQRGYQDSHRGKTYLCNININPSDMAVALCFSLPDSYPAGSPRIEIEALAETISDDCASRLLDHLYQVAQENLGGAAMHSLVESARDFILENPDAGRDSASAAEVGTDGATHTHQSSEDNTPKAGERQGKKMHLAGELSDKPPKKPMKTATDVISRIQWDDQINAQHFIVGYLDRFIGIVEQPFTAFYWEDISGVDHRTLAIPRHRIQYFKYKDEIVWDKTKRLDNVFGSQGSGVTIIDVVRRYTKENAAEGGSGDEKEADDMIEDIEVDGGNDYGANQNSMATFNALGRPRKKRDRPNYFIAVRITDNDIRMHAKRIQDSLSDRDPLVTPYLIPPAHLHVTLCMLQLDSDSEINAALTVLKCMQPELMSLLLPVTILRFQGVDTFHGRIVYLQPEQNPAFKQLALCLRKALLKDGVKLTGTREEFVPHLTVMKMPREEMDVHPVCTADLNSQYEDTYFGCQVVDAIHLCSMGSRPAHDRFYHSLAKIDLQME